MEGCFFEGCDRQRSFAPSHSGGAEDSAANERGRTCFFTFFDSFTCAVLCQSKVFFYHDIIEGQRGKSHAPRWNHHSCNRVCVLNTKNRGGHVQRTVKLPIRPSAATQLQQPPKISGKMRV